jgi:alkaline phosphatase D
MIERARRLLPWRTAVWSGPLSRSVQNIFPGIGLVLFLALAGCSALQDADRAISALPPALALGPLLGETTPSSARVWVQGAVAGDWQVQIGSRADLAGARSVQGPRLTAQGGFTAVAEVDGLRPATRYFYRIVLDGRATAGPPWSFVTAPPDGQAGRFRIAFISCVGAPPAAAVAWQDLADGPAIDLLLQLGDNHYADTTDPELQAAAYRAQRDSPGYRKVSARTPILGIWDDHDFATNNSDGTAPGKERSLATFKRVWANPAYGQADDPGVYFKASWGDVEIFMLDGRYHRSPNRAADDGGKTMLGPGQLAWLKRGLLASRAKIKFIASGGEWRTRGSSDSWSSFARERAEIFRFIEDEGIEGVVLLSGDRHKTAGYHVRNRFIEITSGPFGSDNLKTWDSPETFFEFNDGRYYSVFEVDTRGAEPVLILEVYRVDRGLILARRFSWTEINGAARIARSGAGSDAPRPRT